MWYFSVFGLLPVVLGWGIYWIFKAKKNEKLTNERQGT
jgi:hypothetical protein